MKTLTIAYYTIVRNFRDKKTLAMMLLLPIVLILILGSALSGVFTTGDIGTITVCYLNEDIGALSKYFDEFLQNEGVKDIIAVKKVSSYEEGVAQVKSREATSLIHIGKNYSKSIMEGKKAVIKVYSSQYNNFKASVVGNIIDSYTDSANAIAAAAKLGAPMNTAFSYDRGGSLEQVSFTTRGTTPSSMDYYAVTMLIMTLMYGTMYGCTAMSEDQFEKTYIRLNSAPVSSSELVAGKILGNVVSLFLQAVVLILFTKLAYHVNWGSSIGIILFICLSIIVLAVGLGIMVFNIVKNVNAATALLSVLVTVFTFMGGGYFPIDVLSPVFEKISYLSPNYLAQQAIFNTVFSGSAAETQVTLLIIWGLAAVVFIVSGLTGRRKGSW